MPIALCANQKLGSSKQTLRGEWCRPFCSRPRVWSSKGPKPVVMRGPERVLPEDQCFLSISPKNSNCSIHLSHKCPTHLSHKCPTHLSHNCPTHLSHKMPHPHLPLCFNFTLYVCMKFRTSMCQRCWCSPLDTQLQQKVM